MIGASCLPGSCGAGGPEFSYSSCMNQGEAQGSMEGAFSFAPGNLTNPSGPDFEAQVRAEGSVCPWGICHANGAMWQSQLCCQME